MSTLPSDSVITSCVFVHVVLCDSCYFRNEYQFHFPVRFVRKMGHTMMGGLKSYNKLSPEEQKNLTVAFVFVISFVTSRNHHGDDNGISTCD